MRLQTRDASVIRDTIGGPIVRYEATGEKYSKTEWNYERTRESSTGTERNSVEICDAGRAVMKSLGTERRSDRTFARSGAIVESCAETIEKFGVILVTTVGTGIPTAMTEDMVIGEIVTGGGIVVAGVGTVIALTHGIVTSDNTS
jgi:hypothetical protein